MSSERSIPHLRDIFGIDGYQSHHTPAAYGRNTSNQHSNNNNNVCTQIDQNIDFTTKKSSKKKRDNNKTLTPGDVKTLERHLSMKKTIRKKIMRDLQQAFVDDPNEFRDTSSSEQLKAEIRADAFRFGDKSNTHETDNFLDMLRGEKTQSAAHNRDYSSHRTGAYDSYDTQPPQQQQNGGAANEKQSFWRRFTMKVKR